MKKKKVSKSRCRITAHGNSYVLSKKLVTQFEVAVFDKVGYHISDGIFSIITIRGSFFITPKGGAGRMNGDLFPGSTLEHKIDDAV